MMAYDIRIRAEITDEDGNEIATLDRTYVARDMGTVERCFSHATRTGLLLLEGVQFETHEEKTEDGG